MLRRMYKHHGGVEAPSAGGEPDPALAGVENKGPDQGFFQQGPEETVDKLGAIRLRHQPIMKILQILPRKPYPPTDGGRIVAYNTIKHLAELGHQITAVSLTEEMQRPRELEKYCNWIPVEKDTSTTVRGLIGNLVSGKPYTVSKYHGTAMEKKVLEILSTGKFDLVHADGLHTAEYALHARREFDLPAVLRQHNVETKIMERFYHNQPNPLSKLYGYLQYRKLKSYESEICNNFDRCLTITKKDDERLREMNSEISTSIITAGVDTSYFSPREVEEEPDTIISVAAMDWTPNVEAVLWFHERIFPKIQEEVPEAKFYIVGKNPPEKINGLEGNGTVVTGFVPDVRPYMAKAQAFVVPLKTGSGMRIKILNAMAMKKAVVSTSVGREGIGARDGTEICVADKPDEFAGALISLLKDEEKRESIARRGLELVREQYQWGSVIRDLVCVYRRVLDEYQ